LTLIAQSLAAMEAAAPLDVIPTLEVLCFQSTATLSAMPPLFVLTNQAHTRVHATLVIRATVTGASILTSVEYQR
jgi:hypothetical protein